MTKKLGEHPCGIDLNSMRESVLQAHLPVRGGRFWWELFALKAGITEQSVNYGPSVA